MQEIKTYYYQEGTTARKPEATLLPARNLPTREQRERERREEEKTRAHILQRQRKNALRRNRIMTVYMIMAVISTCFLLVFYVSLQNSVTTRMNHIASLETQLSELNADNAATESRINTSTNLEEVKDRAINDLGMVYATSSQIVYYSTDSSDYMSQYYDIP